MDDEDPSTHTSPWLLLPEEVGLEAAPPPEEELGGAVEPDEPELPEELELLPVGGLPLVEPDEPEELEELELLPDGGLALVPPEPVPGPLLVPLDGDEEELDEDVDLEFPCPLELP